MFPAFDAALLHHLVLEIHAHAWVLSSQVTLTTHKIFDASSDDSIGEKVQVTRGTENLIGLCWSGISDARRAMRNMLTINSEVRKTMMMDSFLREVKHTHLHRCLCICPVCVLLLACFNFVTCMVLFRRARKKTCNSEFVDTAVYFGSFFSFWVQNRIEAFQNRVVWHSALSCPVFLVLLFPCDDDDETCTWATVDGHVTSDMAKSKTYPLQHSVH